MRDDAKTKTADGGDAPLIGQNPFLPAGNADGAAFEVAGGVLNRNPFLPAGPPPTPAPPAPPPDDPEGARAARQARYRPAADALRAALRDAFEARVALAVGDFGAAVEDEQRRRVSAEAVRGHSSTGNDVLAAWIAAADALGLRDGKGRLASEAVADALRGLAEETAGNTNRAHEEAAAAAGLGEAA